MSLTDDPTDPRLTRGVDDKPTGQAEVYLVLSEAERAKGFIRPVRRTYIHVGLKHKHPLRDLTIEEHERYDKFLYIKFEEYPESESPVTGRFWTQKDLDTHGCGTSTTMAQALAETYARDPSFYGGTLCVHCGMHRSVAEFVWEDGTVVGS
jgi:hypothetical protein